jgi:hypothetical protein
MITRIKNIKAGDCIWIYGKYSIIVTKEAERIFKKIERCVENSKCKVNSESFSKNKKLRVVLKWYREERRLMKRLMKIYRKDKRF